MAISENVGAKNGAQPYKRNKEILEWFDSLVLCIVILAVLFTLVGRVVRVDGSSMYDTLEDNDLVLISCLPIDSQRGDIVIVDSYIPHGRPLVKRVIGLPGDEIDIDFEQGIVYRNGEALEEPYAEATYLYEGTDFPLTVPEGTLFLMGDNRNNSMDSRDPDIGFVSQQDIMGRVLFRFSPINRMGAVE